MPVATGKVLARQTPFGSPGKSPGRGRSPCVCSVSFVPTAPALDNRAKSSSSTNVSPAPTSFAVDPYTASYSQRGPINNVVPAQAGFSQGITATPSHQKTNSKTRRKPGRPPGYAAWNKGKSTSASVKKQISESQKTRWKQKPELHAIVSDKLKGIEPWNKGKRMRPETCQKMSAARQGSTLPKAVCAKISQSRTGQMHSQATRLKMSASRIGISLSSETRARIAATHRRRHAASRVLQAVEAFHRVWDVPETSAGKGKKNSSQVTPMQKKRRMVRCLSGMSPGKPTTRTQIMAAYKSQLREYRALQEELGPWTQAFKAQHGRKPCLSDVERAGIDWLMSKFKAYVILRDRLLTDTSILRDKLDVAVPDFGGGSPPPVKMASYATKLNANAASAKRTRSAGTVSAALEYRRQQQALAETAAITAAADTAAGAAAAAIADAAAETDDAGREAVRLATADLQQQYLGGPLGDQALPMQTPLDQDSIAPTRHSEHDGIHDTLPLGSNGAQISGDTGPNEDLEGLQHEQLTGENSDNMYNTANEAASDSKASVSTPLGTSPRQNGAQHHQNGTNGTATASNGQSDGHPTQADGLISAASQTTPPSKAQANGSMPAKEAEVSKQQPARLRDIPAPTLNTSPRIKSALLAAEQYRKQKAAKTAALALAAANAAAAKE